MHANKRERVDMVGQGPSWVSWDSRIPRPAKPCASQEHPVLLEKMEFYEPVISVAVEPKTHSDQEKLQQVLDKFMAEDPTLRVTGRRRHRPDDSFRHGRTASGNHYQSDAARINTRVNVGKPQVVYRETIESAAVGTAVFDKEVAGSRHFGEITLRLEPLPAARATASNHRLAGKNWPPALVKAAEKGVMESLESGILMGYPVVDVKAHSPAPQPVRIQRLGTGLYCGCLHGGARGPYPGESAFLLDPIMDVEVIVPEDFMGEVIGDLNARGGKIESIEPKLGVQTIKATVPLAKMFGYSTSLRSATQGRGTFSMQFSRFDRN
jgi:elongation factor G